MKLSVVLLATSLPAASRAFRPPRAQPTTSLLRAATSLDSSPAPETVVRSPVHATLDLLSKATAACAAELASVDELLVLKDDLAGHSAHIEQQISAYVDDCDVELDSVPTDCGAPQWCVRTSFSA